MKPSAGYLIPRTSVKDLRTNLEIQTQTLGWISRSSTESLSTRPKVSDMWPDICQDIVISHSNFP